MEALYSPSTQTLALIPRSSSSSLSSSSVCLCVSRFQSIRGEFFGYGAKLRLRNHRKCERSRIHLTATAEVAVASLFPVPVVAVVVAMTISAVAIAFSNLSNSKREKNSDEVRDPPLSVHERDGKNASPNLETSEKNYSLLEAVDSIRKDDIEVVKLSNQDLSSTAEEIVAGVKAKISESNSLDILSVPQLPIELGAQQPVPLIGEESEASSLSERSEVMSLSTPEVPNKLEFAIYMEDSEVSVLSDENEIIQQASPESDAVQPLNVLEEDSDLVNIGADLTITSHDHVVETKSPLPEPLNFAIKKEENVDVLSHEDDESGSSSYESASPDREDLYLFYQNTFESGNSALLHQVSGLSTDTSMESYTRQLTTRLAASELLPKDHSQDAGTGEYEAVATHARGSFQERKNSWKKRVNPKSEPGEPSVRVDRKDFNGTPSISVKQQNGRYTGSNHINSYNRLLKMGRLNQCVQLLEDTESNNLLDMNEIYHAKFFNLCRAQKAVKEAFRFAKLIPNPTLSTFNMLMSVCSAAQDSEGAFVVWQLVQQAGLIADCKLYTTLISSCAKSGKVDTMFEVFHDMVNNGVEPNVHTYGALIDGCARAGQVAKAFGAYGILRSKNVKPDRVVFNALISACGQCGAVDRAFDVLSEMRAELQPIDPDHITIGALIRACTSAGQADRVKEVYGMINQYDIRGTPELYTIAVNSCGETGDWDFACNIYADMKRKGVVPDEMFFSALIDVAGHAGNLDAAFDVLQDARIRGLNPGIVSYSSLMGACSNTQNWKRALELFEQIKGMELSPTVSTVNALITALCDAGQMQKALDILLEMKEQGFRPNDVTYSILIAASEKKDDIEVGLALFYQAKADTVPFSQIMCKCLIKMCSRRFEKSSTIGESILSFKSGRPQIDSKWSSLALTIYREMIGAGLIPSMEMLSQVLGCLQLPQDMSLKKRLTETLGVNAEISRKANLVPLVDGFAEYDTRAFSLFEEAASLGIVPCVSFKESPIVIDARNLNIHITKVYILTVLKGLRHRLAAGARLPSVTVTLPVETTKVSFPAGEKIINISGRTSQAVGALLRRLRLLYLGNESQGKIRITGLALKRWLQPNLASSMGGEPSSPLWLMPLGLAKEISHQQRNIRTGNLSLN